MYKRQDEDIVEGLRFLITAVRNRQPKATIQVMGILPRREHEDWVKNINRNIRTMAEEENCLFGDAGPALLPVSYTHLDVYKRQPVRIIATNSADSQNNPGSQRKRSARIDKKVIRKERTWPDLRYTKWMFFLKNSYFSSKSIYQTV